MNNSSIKENCPFCGNLRMAPFFTEYHEGTKSFLIRCGKCLASGPFASTSEEATNKWNKEES